MAKLALNKESLVKVGVCIVGMLLFVGLTIVPSNFELTRLKREIVMTRVDIEQQKVLFPVYLDFLRRIADKVVKVLPVVAVEPMSEDKVHEATQMLEQRASTAGLAVQSVVPDPVSLAEGSGQVLVNCELFGKFSTVREFLISLGEVPYFKHIQEVTLEEGHGGLLFKMKVRLAVKTTA